MVLDIQQLDKKYYAKEWKDKETGGEIKHRIYVMGPNGEIGYYDVKSGIFNNSKKTTENFGVVSKYESKITLITKDYELHLGNMNEKEFDEENITFAKEVEKLHSLTPNGGRIEINVGPSLEIKIGGKSHWAKSNLTLSVDNPENIQELYETISNIAHLMLNKEVEKLKNR